MCKKRIFTCVAYNLLVFAIACGLMFFLARPVYAAIGEYNFRWNNIFAKFQNQNTPYQSNIQSAASDWDRTDLHVSYLPNGHSADLIHFRQDNRGAGFPVARAIAYYVPPSGGIQPCFNLSDGSWTGNCNKTDRKASYGKIYLNTYYSDFINSHTDTVIRHEPGHIFAMQHSSCSDNSIMRGGECGTWFSALQQMDIDWINARY